MITPEFKSAVSGGNLLRARIMLKDSLIVDPTHVQFDEMLNWVQRAAPGLVVPYDGEPLEDDSSKWNLELMNLELSQLVGNFSDTRIRHLKQVIALVLKDEIKKCRNVQAVSDDERRRKRGQALARARVEGEKIEQILKKINQQERTWKSDQIRQMKQAAQNIVDAISEYEGNK